MRHKKLIIILLNLIIFSVPFNLSAKWIQIGPCGGWITCMKSLPQNPQIMFCGVLQGGAFISHDRGDNWSVISEMGEYNPVYDMSISPNGTIYIASKKGLFFSQNAGSSWEKIHHSPTWQIVALNDSTLAADTTKTPQAYAGGRHPVNHPWLISFDNGQNWQFWQGTVDSSISSSQYLLPHQKRGNIIVTPDNEVYRTEGLRIFKTINNEWTEWQHLRDLDPSFYNSCRAFLVPPDSTGTLYVFAEYYDFHPGGYFLGGIFKSNDSFQHLSKIGGISSASAMTLKDDNIFIGITDGVPYNTMSKLLLQEANTYAPDTLALFGGDITAIDAAKWDSGELIVATESGIYKTVNHGNDWFDSNNGIYRINAVASEVLSLDDKGERIVLAVHKGGIWSSEDDGSTWNHENRLPYILPGLLKRAPNYPEYLYAGGFNILNSFDYGHSWHEINADSFPAHYYGWYGRATDIAIDPEDPRHVFAHYFDRSMDDLRGVICAETFDTGHSWTERKWFDGQYNHSSKAAYDSHRLWISSDSIEDPALMVIDSTWEDPKRTINLPNHTVPTFWCTHGDTCYILDTNSAEFLRSDDLGETWFIHDFGNLQYTSYWQDWAVQESFGQLVLSPDKHMIFFVYPATGVLYSKDQGETWESLNTGLASLNTYQIAFSPVNPDMAYLATANGFFKLDLMTNVDWDKSKLTIAENPNNFILCNNFPDPFNATTTISIQIRKAGKTILSIYNLLGIEVARIIDNQYVATGEHFIQWDASDYASGIYLIKLTVDNESVIKKALLTK